MRIPILIATLASLLLAALIFPVVGENVYDFATQEQYTGRQEIWRAAWKTAYDYPVFGTGPGNSTQIMSKYIDTPYLRGQDSHSLYLKNAAEMGFPSVMILLAFYVGFFYSSGKIERTLQSDYLKLATRGVLATFIGLLVHGVFENGFFLTPFVGAEFYVLLPYILMVLPFACKRLEEKAGTV
jgi:O-antigen ligase